VLTYVPFKTLQDTRLFDSPREDRSQQRHPAGAEERATDARNGDCGTGTGHDNALIECDIDGQEGQPPMSPGAALHDI
jgi:hypothetical protein